MDSRYYTLLSKLIKRYESLIPKIEELLSIMKDDDGDFQYYRFLLGKYKNDRKIKSKKFIKTYRFFR